MVSIGGCATPRVQEHRSGERQALQLRSGELSYLRLGRRLQDNPSRPGKSSKPNSCKAYRSRFRSVDASSVNDPYAAFQRRTIAPAVAVTYVCQAPLKTCGEVVELS